MGFRPSLPDSLPAIGRVRATPRVVYAFGHGHLGLTQSAATGRLVADLVTGARPIDMSSFASTLLTTAPMARHTFFCIDGHTCGNPVRLVAGGGPHLDGANMIERRAHFLRGVRLDPHRPDVRAARP